MVKRASLLLNLFFLISFAAMAQWKNVKSTSITFKIKNAGIGVDGVFKKVNVQAFVDEANPANSKFSGIADANSVSTGIKLRDTHLKEKDEFFDAAKFPSLTMKSVSVVLKSAGIYSVTWDLTIKGITRRFTTDVIVKVDANVLHLSTEFRIDRNDWKVGGSSITMGDKVTVKLSSTLSK